MKGVGKEVLSWPTKPLLMENKQQTLFVVFGFIACHCDCKSLEFDYSSALTNEMLTDPQGGQFGQKTAVENYKKNNA